MPRIHGQEDYYGETKGVGMGLAAFGRESLRTRIGRLESEHGDLIERVIHIEKDILALESLIGERSQT